MIAFDTEDDSKGKIYIINFYDGQNHHTFKNKKAAVRFIMESDEYYFIAHNIEYDLVNIFYPFNMDLLEMFYSGGRLLYAKLKGTRKKFYDSFNFSFTSLKAIGETIGLKKMETDDYNNVEYCRRDCEIVYRYMSNFHDSLSDEFDMKPKATIAGTSQNVYLNCFDGIGIGGMNTNPEYLKAYYGGRVECFHVGAVDRYIAEMDVNSMYPFVMKNNEYPVSEGIEGKKPKGCFIAEVEIEICDCDVPVIPYRDGLLYFPAGRFRTWVTSAEFNHAETMNQIKDCKFVKVYNFAHTGKLFDEFIDYFYSKRIEAKKTGNKFLSSYYKMIMNSTYGRFALNKSMDVYTTDGFREGQFIEQIGDMRRYSMTINDEKKKNYIVPVFITAYSRIQLHKMITEVKRENYIPLYCDTDSVYYCADKPVDIQSFSENIHDRFNIGNELGECSVNIYRHGNFINAKQYYCISFGDFFEKYKCKGVPKGQRKEFFTTGKASYKRPMRFRSGIRSVQEIEPNQWYDYTITGSAKYKKRRVIETENIFNTRPIVIH